MEFADIRKAVFDSRPVFAEVVTEWGDRTLLDYYTQEFVAQREPSKAVLDCVSLETKKLLGEAVAEQAKEALLQQRWVNTADHHGILHHPYFYASSLARSHSLVRKGTQATVTLAFGGVSLGNDSFPRGFSFHDKNLTLRRVFLKSLKERRLPVYALKPLPREVLLMQRERCARMALSAKAQERLQAFFDTLLADERVWVQSSYSAQLTVINSIVWKQLFHQDRGELVYLEIDTIVNELLYTKHFVENTHINTLLFDGEWRADFLQLFDGIAGAHGQNFGTHFFWYIDYAQNTRRRLMVVGDELKTAEGDVTISLTPEALAEGLQKKTLMPSTVFIMLVVEIMGQLTCGGGPNQAVYVDAYKRAWTALLEKRGIKTTFQNTTILSENEALFSVGRVASSERRIATLFDLLLYTQEPNTVTDRALEEVAIKDMIDALIPTYYSMITKKKVDNTAVQNLAHINIDAT
jgi:hypothetical protein